MTTFFISDTHFNHSNIIRYTNRPFSSAREMDEAMISNWNSVVSSRDTVYHLGDVGWGSPSFLAMILNRLNGKKILIKGNHDKSIKHEAAECFETIKDYDKVYVSNKQMVVMCHYSMQVWDKSHYGSVMLYGHSHGKLPGNSQSLDVGVDCWNFFPVSFEQISERLKTLPQYSI